MPWLRKYRLRAEEDVGVTRSNLNRKSTDSRTASVSKSVHENTVAKLEGEIEYLKRELEKAHIQLLMADTASKDDRDMSRSDAEEEIRGTNVNDSGTERTGSDSESSSASKRSAGKLQLPDPLKKERDDSTNESPFEVYE